MAHPVDEDSCINHTINPVINVLELTLNAKHYYQATPDPEWPAAISAAPAL